MPRSRNPKCVACALEPVEEAKAKSCWEGQKCHNRRYWYRHNKKQKTNRRIKYAVDQGYEPLAVSESGLPKIKPYAILIVERDGGAKDSKIVGMSADVYLDGDKADLVAPFRAKHGVTGREWKQYSIKILNLLKDKFGITVYSEQVNIDVSREQK